MCAGQGEKQAIPEPAPVSDARAPSAPRAPTRQRRIDPGATPARIAIVGDSISHSGETVGRLGRTLQQMLADDVPGIAVDTHAVPGQTCGRMIERFGAEVVAVAPPYDTVIIQCGTNDLYNDLGLKRIADDMDTMISMGRGAGMRVVLLTVPPANGYDGWSAAKERKRTGLNLWIRGHADVTVVDSAAILGTGEPPALREEFFLRDWIHPNDRGLDAVAGAVASALGFGG
jgi:lysophospholipase L1-like esterase